jgi:hypothetical protein
VRGEGMDSVAGVVGVAGADGEGAVDLLGEDDGGEFVGEGDAAEGEGAFGAFERGRGPAVGRADGEEGVLGSGVLEGAEDGGEFGRGDLLASAVGEEEGGTGAGGGVVEEVEEPGFGGEDALGAGCKALATLQIEVKERGGGPMEAGSAGGDEGNRNFHR